MNQPPPDPEKAPPASGRPTPRRLHADSTLSPAALDFWRKQKDDDILTSLSTGRLGRNDVGKLVLQPDGTVMNGNTRVKCLEERGHDLNKLWDLVEPDEASARRRFDELFP
jgi:hypothetical protein